MADQQRLSLLQFSGRLQAGPKANSSLSPIPAARLTVLSSQISGCTAKGDPPAAAELQKRVYPNCRERSAHLPICSGIEWREKPSSEHSFLIEESESWTFKGFAVPEVSAIVTLDIPRSRDARLFPEHQRQQFLPQRADK